MGPQVLLPLPTALQKTKWKFQLKTRSFWCLSLWFPSWQYAMPSWPCTCPSSCKPWVCLSMACLAKWPSSWPTWIHIEWPEPFGAWTSIFHSLPWSNIWQCHQLTLVQTNWLPRVQPSPKACWSFSPWSPGRPLWRNTLPPASKWCWTACLSTGCHGATNTTMSETQTDVGS